MDKIVFRGDIFTTDLGRGIGSEHSGVKYCLVIQNDKGNQHSTTTVIIPITSERKNMCTHVEIKGVLPKTSYVMCEQIRVVDMKRLKNRVARLPDEDMLEVKRKMWIQLGIK